MNDRDVIQVKCKFFAALVLIIGPIVGTLFGVISCILTVYGVSHKKGRYVTCFCAALSVIYFGNGMSIYGA